MRIGYGTDVRKHYYAAVDALMELWDAMPDDEEGARRRDELNAELQRARTGFVNASRALIGTAEEIVKGA